MKKAVVDQPGLKIIFIGLLVSLVLGLSIKNQLQPYKLKSRFDRLIERLRPDLKIDFQSAEIILSDWGWPHPYLFIKDIRISPVKPLCDDSQIYIENLTFPLNWNLIFSNSKRISSVRLSQVEIRVSDLKNCFSEKDQQNTYQLFTVKSSAELKSVKIDQLKLINKSSYQYPLYFQSVQIDLSYLNSFLNQIDLKSQLVAFKVQDKPLFKLKSDLEMKIVYPQYDHSKKTTENHLNAELSLKGRFLDKKFDSTGDFDFMTKKLKWSFKFQDLYLKNFSHFTLSGAYLKFYDFFKENLTWSIDGDISGIYSVSENSFEYLTVHRFFLQAKDSFVLDLKEIESHDQGVSQSNRSKTFDVHYVAKDLDLENSEVVVHFDEDNLPHLFNIKDSLLVFKNKSSVTEEDHLNSFPVFLSDLINKMGVLEFPARKEIQGSLTIDYEKNRLQWDLKEEGPKKKKQRFFSSAKFDIFQFNEK